MTIWFDADGANARVGIYTGNDDLPMANPTAHIGGRLKFHTDFNYIPFVPAKKISTTVSVPAVNGSFDRVINLGAHGAAGVPFIFGIATIGGTQRPLCGCVPIYANTGSGNAIFWTLGVNATNVFIAEGRSWPFSIGGGLNIPITVYVSDKLVDG